MKRKKYIKPVIEVIKTEPSDIICLSYAVREDDDESEYIIPPTIAGETEWSEEESGGGGIWGDLD